MSYTKLFSSIVTSTIWTEDPKICKVWVTMLAIADKHGEVHASIPGLAQIAGMTLADTEAAIQKFLSPDKYSRTPDDEGRRIEKIDDGWLLLNHAKYRAMASKDEEKTSAAKRQAAFRERQKRNGKITACHGSVTGSNAVVTPSRDIADTDSKAEAEAEGEAKAYEEGRSPVVTAPPIPPSPPVILKRPKRAIAMAEGEWIAHLENDPTYRGIDVRRELGKMQQWCLLKKKPASQQRFLSWLNRIDKPILGTSQISAPLSDEQREISTWFGRQPDDWTAEERQMWDALPMLTKEDMDALRWFYTKSGYGYLRKSLPSLLKNLRAEIDTAKNYTPETK